MTDIVDLIRLSKIAPWTLINQRAAARQGWNVFNSGEAEARIERDDERGTFEDDTLVWEFVAREASRGKDLCRRALLHVAIHNPDEFILISRHLEGITI